MSSGDSAMAPDSLEVLMEGDMDKISDLISDTMEGMDPSCGRYAYQYMYSTKCRCVSNFPEQVKIS